MTLDKVRTGTGRRFRAEGLQETALPIPYNAAAMPGATVLGTDGRLYNSVKDSGDPLEAIAGQYAWRVPLWLDGTERLILGNAVSRSVGGASAPRTLQIETGSNSFDTFGTGISVIRNSEDATAGQIILGKTRSSVTGGSTPVQSGDSLGTFAFSGASASGGLASSRAGTRGFVESINSTDFATALLFLTSQNAGGVIERARITSNGNFLLGNTTGTERLSVTGSIQLTNTADSYKVGANNVIGSRKAGWAAPTGTATRTTFATSSVTTEQLAERVKALIDDLTSHGLIGA